MAENKTKPTDARVEAHLASRAGPGQLADCQALMAICAHVTQQSPAMWGPSIVGYGSYTYKYDSGRTGTACLTGFAIRGKELVVYLGCEAPAQAELRTRLGTHRMSKSCLYFKRLADLDPAVLESLIAGSVAELQRLHSGTGGAG